MVCFNIIKYELLLQNRKFKFYFALDNNCENYDLTDKELMATINEVLNKPISRRTYYNYNRHYSIIP